MPEFLVETYAPRDAPDIIALGAGDIALAADQVSEQGAQVRLLHAIFLPEDETCFYLFESSSAATVRQAMTRARLQPDRITQAVSIRPPEAGPAAPSSAPPVARPARAAAGVSPSPFPGTAPDGTFTAVNLGLWPCYQLNINTADYPAGSYTLSFTAGSDPTTHRAQFVVP